MTTSALPTLTQQNRPPPIRMRSVRSDRLTVMHIGTLNKPIGTTQGYSPVETVIENIHRGLRSRGHRSIVACSADSPVPGERFATVPRSLGDYICDDSPERRELVHRHLSGALARLGQGDIDVVHMHEHAEHVCHAGYRPPAPIVVTLHVRASTSGLRDALADRRNALAKRAVFVAISDSQAAEYVPFMTPAATIHHGLNINDFPFKTTPPAGGYLFTIGRISRVKGQHRAIELARRTGATLVIAGCVQNKAKDAAFFHSLTPSIDTFADLSQEPVGPDYFERVMQPVLASGARVIYVGELGLDQKKQWYLHARATLFPIQWPEPFGLVLIESMACGTPVLAFNEGAVPEIVATGRTGFVVNSMDEMVMAEPRLASLDPAACRTHVRTHFSTRRMVNEYTDVYRRAIDDYHHPSAIPSSVEQVSVTQ